jgi:hypothetical protein
MAGAAASASTAPMAMDAFFIYSVPPLWILCAGRIRLPDQDRDRICLSSIHQKARFGPRIPGTRSPNSSILPGVAQASWPDMAKRVEEAV